MVQVLRKLSFALVVCLLTLAVGAGTLEIKDSSTWRFIDEVYVNDAATWRQLKKVEIKDGGTWRTTYWADIYTVNVGNTGSTYGYSNIAGQNIGSISPTTTTEVVNQTAIIPAIAVTGSTASVTVCSNVSLGQSAFTKALLYDDTSVYLDQTTASATFSETFNGTNICSDTAPGWSYQSSWSWTVTNPWSSDVGQNRKVLLVD